MSNKIVNKFKIKNPKKALIFGLGIQIGGVWYTWAKLSEIFNIQNKKDKELANKLENENKEGDFDSTNPAFDEEAVKDWYINVERIKNGQVPIYGVNHKIIET